MFESLQTGPEPAKAWLIRFYLFYCVLGASGALIGFWKYGTSRPLGLVCYAAVSVLAAYFFVAARTTRPTSGAISKRCLVLLCVSFVPSWVHLFLMK
jgi:hypothetical protein